MVDVLFFDAGTARRPPRQKLASRGHADPSAARRAAHYIVHHARSFPLAIIRDETGILDTVCLTPTQERVWPALVLGGAMVPHLPAPALQGGANAP